MESVRPGDGLCAVCRSELPPGTPSGRGARYCSEGCKEAARSEFKNSRRQEERRLASEAGRRTVRTVLFLAVSVTVVTVTLAIAQGESVPPRAFRLLTTVWLAVLVYRGHAWARWVYACVLLAGALMAAFLAASLMFVSPAVSVALFFFGAIAIGAGVPLIFSANVRAFLEQQRAERLGTRSELRAPDASAEAARAGDAQDAPAADAPAADAPAADTIGAPQSRFETLREDLVRTNAKLRGAGNNWNRLRAIAYKPALGLYTAGLVGFWGLAGWVGVEASISLSNLLCLVMLLGAAGFALRGSLYARGGLVGAGVWLFLQAGNAARALAMPADWFGDVKAPLPGLFFTFLAFTLVYAISTPILVLGVGPEGGGATPLDRHLRSGFGLLIGVAAAVLLGRPKLEACRSTSPVSFEQSCGNVRGPDCNAPGCRPAVPPCVSTCELYGEQGLCSGFCKMHQGRCVQLCEAFGECEPLDCGRHGSESECRKFTGYCTYSECRGSSQRACEEFPLSECPGGRNCRMLAY